MKILGKYRNKKVIIDGLKFDSILEANVYRTLKILSDTTGLVIEQQPKVVLTKAQILYKPDFKCTETTGEVYYVEAKGMETPVWRLKRRLWMHYGPAPLKVYMKSGLKETIHPL